jgi:5-methylcytosine-specific restriction endonuclease McrA
VKPFKHHIRVASTFRIKGKRLSGGSWTTLRNAYLRSNPSCERCTKPGEEVHHIIPRAVRPDLTYDWSNLKTMCRECHCAIHRDSAANAKPL